MAQSSRFAVSALLLTFLLLLSAIPIKAHAFSFGDLFCFEVFGCSSIASDKTKALIAPINRVESSAFDPFGLVSDRVTEINNYCHDKFGFTSQEASNCIRNTIRIEHGYATGNVPTYIYNEAAFACDTSGRNALAYQNASSYEEFKSIYEARVNDSKNYPKCVEEQIDKLMREEKRSEADTGEETMVSSNDADSSWGVNPRDRNSDSGQLDEDGNSNLDVRKWAAAEEDTLGNYSSDKIGYSFLDSLLGEKQNNSISVFDDLIDSQPQSKWAQLQNPFGSTFDVNDYEGIRPDWSKPSSQEKGWNAGYANWLSPQVTVEPGVTIYPYQEYISPEEADYWMPGNSDVNPSPEYQEIKVQ